MVQGVYTVYIAMPDKTTLAVKTEPHDDITHIKARVTDKTGIARRLQRLLWRGEDPQAK